MKEHMDVPIDTSNMSEQELQFHYFKMHDSDGNNKLGKYISKDCCKFIKTRSLNIAGKHYSQSNNC